MMRMMKIWIVMMAVGILALGCGDKKESGDSKKTTEAPVDPAQAALASFKAHVKATFPGTEKALLTSMSYICEIKKVDVVKVNSVSSPYEGVIEGLATTKLNGVDLPDVVKVISIRFAKTDSGWQCSNAGSLVVFNGKEEAGVVPCDLLATQCEK